ncbi:MAG: ferrochelatase [bacterium]
MDNIRKTQPSPPIGVLIAQLGTPAAPTPSALRRYLRQFLSDPRVIEINRLLWWLILNLIVLVVRPKKSARLYQRIWTKEGSPLLSTSQAQVRKLQAALDRECGKNRFRVILGMRYGNPSLAAALDTLCREGVDRIVLFPMYPQYSGPTTASTYDEVCKHLLRRRVVPALHVIPPYYDHPHYLRALANSVRESLDELAWKPEKVVVTYHGLPQRYVDGGDPYYAHCASTTRALANELDWAQEEYLMCFQSRFGREEWLRPYTDEMLRTLGRQGVQRIAAVCPAFVTDCLETIDEIGEVGKQQFREAGGEELHLISCLNAREDWIEAMKEMILQETAGWRSFAQQSYLRDQETFMPSALRSKVN